MVVDAAGTADGGGEVFALPAHGDMADRADVSTAERAYGVFTGDDEAMGVGDDTNRDDELEEQAIELTEAIDFEPSTQGVPNSMLFNWSLS